MLHVPLSAPLSGIQVSFPFVIIGDEGFSLSEKLLIPYQRLQYSKRKDRRIFNYRYVNCL